MRGLRSRNRCQRPAVAATTSTPEAPPARTGGPPLPCRRGDSARSRSCRTGRRSRTRADTPGEIRPPPEGRRQPAAAPLSTWPSRASFTPACGELPNAAASIDETREGLVNVGRQVDLGETPLWTRVNSLDSPWFLDDVTRLVAEIGDRLEVVMIPKVEGPWDIHYVDRLLAQLEARHRLRRPFLVHAILETALGVTNVEEICAASPRMQGISFGPADLAASRPMKTTRVGGGHPAYLVRTDPDPKHPDAPRPTAQQDPWHYSIARMVDACAATGCLPFYGPFGDISDPLGCEDQFRAAFLLGCVGAWSLHPSQIAIAKKE